MVNSFKDEEKIQDTLTDYKKKCSCGHSVIVLPTTKKDYVTCRWCGKRVYKDDAAQAEHNKKVERENFRLKMWSVL